jgi:hypothetical protein
MNLQCLQFFLQISFLFHLLPLQPSSLQVVHSLHHSKASCLSLRRNFSSRNKRHTNLLCNIYCCRFVTHFLNSLIIYSMKDNIIFFKLPSKLLILTQKSITWIDCLFVVSSRILSFKFLENCTLNFFWS